MSEVIKEISPHPIVVNYDSWARQWIAHFATKPDDAYGGDLPVAAIRRLLDGTEAEYAVYQLFCDQDLSGRGVFDRTIIWDPPELLCTCPDCHGRGEYFGLVERETCRMCNGRAVVAV
jgi:hypothetical protein